MMGDVTLMTDAVRRQEEEEGGGTAGGGGGGGRTRESDARAVSLSLFSHHRAAQKPSLSLTVTDFLHDH